MQKWQRRKDERPAEIMLAALSLFVANGFSCTKIDDIAARAGVSKGTVYLYYASKEALFKEIVYELMLPKIEEVEGFIAGYKGSQLELLKLVIRHWWKTINESGLTGVPKLILSESHLFPDLTRFYVKEVISRIHSIVNTILQKGIKQNEFRKIDTVLTARVIMSSLVYFSMWDIALKEYDQKDLTVNDMIEQQLLIVINGIKK